MARTVICLRYFLLGYVILLGITGVIVAIGSGIFIYRLKEYHPLTPEDVTGPAILLLVMGLVTCLVSWCGWHVLDATHTFQIICFTVILALVTMTEIGSGIWSVIRHEQIDSLRTKTIESAFALAIADDKPLWDRMQMRLSCCGIDGPADYRITNSVPWSCCDTSSLASPSTTEAACANLYVRGCLHPVINRTRSTLLHVFLLAICSALVQIGGVVASCFFVRSIQENVQKRRRQVLAGLAHAPVAQPIPPEQQINAESRLYGPNSQT